MKRLVSTLIGLGCFFLAKSQQNSRNFGFELPPKKNKIEIPFEEFNNLIVIPVVINKLIRLKFVVDTGVQTTLLTDKFFGHLLNLQYSRRVVIQTPGIKDSVAALVANGLHMTLPGKVHGKNLNMLVLEEDYLKLSEKLGSPVYGVIGYDLFRKFVVKINYDNKILTLIRPDKFKAKRKYQSIALEVVDTKPYMKALARHSEKQDTLRLLIDTGASHAILLDIRQTKFSGPIKSVPTQIGTGVGGEIHGEVSRLDGWEVKAMKLKNLIMSIPNPDEYSQLLKRGSRHGTVGGELLSRFNPIFDYRKERLYLSKGRRFRKKFEYDMSGLGLSTRGEDYDSIYVENVRADSPAEGCGIHRGDYILSINGHSLKTDRLGDIISLLRKRPHLKIRATIFREGQILKKKFRLRRSI